MTDPQIDVHLEADAWAPQLRADVLAGLTASPKTLPPKWFYDDAGSDLFDQITRLPEYYPTEAEREILVSRAGEIARLSGADTVIELGSGTSDKTRALLDAFTSTGQLQRFVPFDVSEQTLIDAAKFIGEDYPGLVIHAVVGDFERHLNYLPTGGKRMIVFLGGTIGNFTPSERLEFLRSLVATMAPGDSFLLGTDLVKDHDRLVTAYDDSEGVTAEFNKNVLKVINRNLDADFDLSTFDHVALFNTEQEWIEMRLRSRIDQLVHIGALDLEVPFVAGEEIRTEISAKFTADRVRNELGMVGLELTNWWTDSDGDFGVSLSRPTAALVQ
ncbi:MAG: L-histidine N(alpha)-methyltransferase [Acidimicrobiales bacterium]